ncbi:Squalene/phytoene synthase [Planctomycetes bacterium Pla163]|uniref:Squalene/phytoene synthase n=1 Tax=Rohdeia mirabilis TaxID=2528008 RepID=A0A518CV15_9BACT|nr:Squalene/phytoene synthase [Planctomycetes bacterium Pla163]
MTADVTGLDAARACVRLVAGERGRAFGMGADRVANLLPGQPWRDPLLAPALAWLHLLEHDPGVPLGALAAVLGRARDGGAGGGGASGAGSGGGGATTVLGRGLAWSLGQGAWSADDLDGALGAARALERGGAFSTRRELAERALAWSGGAATAVLEAWDARPSVGARLRRAAVERLGEDFGAGSTGRRAEGRLDPARALEQRIARMEAGLVAERLTCWTADPSAALAAGRLVLPMDELARLGLTAVDLAERPDDPRWAELIASQVGFVRGLCAKAWPLVSEVGLARGRTVAVWLAGIDSALERIERARFLTTAMPVSGPRASWSSLARLAGPESYRGLG